MLLGVNLTTMGQITMDGSVAATRTEYFVVNVASGLYLKFGGANNAKAAEGHAGTIITLEGTGDRYAIKTNAGYLGSDLMMTGSASEWIFTKVEGKNQYYLKTSNGRGVLSTRNDANGILTLSSYNPDDNKQKWILLTRNNLSQLLDVTPLIRAAAFDKNDAIGAWGLDAGDITVTNGNSNAENHHLTVTGRGSFTQDLGACTAGTYVLTFDAYYKRTSSNGNVTAPTISATVKKSTSVITVGEGTTWEKYSMTLANNGGKSMSITITSNNNVELHVDNFLLKHIGGHNQGEDQVEQEDRAQIINRLNAYIAQKQEEVDLLNEAGQAAYDISAVIADRDAGRITSEETLQAAIAAINTAYEIALAAHNQKELEDLLGGGGDDGEDDGGDTPGDEEEDKEVDVTDLFIKNAGFGTGDDRYWTINGAVISTSGIGVTGATGSYLFRGTSIRQDVNVPNGKYSLTAKAASTNGATVSLIANEGKLTEQSTSLRTTTAMSEITLEKVIVYDGMLFIHATSDEEFYIDDFSLSYQEALPDDPQLKDTESLTAEVDFYPTITISRTIKPGTWSTFTVPFDMEIPAGWEVKGLSGSVLEDNSITLTFSDASGIEAGVPYMVRVAEEVSTITGTNVWLDYALTPTETECVNFVGAYVNGTVPVGSYFISSNMFYRCVNVNNPNKLKAYRAYIEPTGQNAEARGISYRFASKEQEPDEETTAVEVERTGASTVVAIYTLGGVRIDEMQEGINIVQMSDGSVVKVIIR